MKIVSMLHRSKSLLQVSKAGAAEDGSLGLDGKQQTVLERAEESRLSQLRLFDPFSVLIAAERRYGRSAAYIDITSVWELLDSPRSDEEPK